LKALALVALAAVPVAAFGQAPAAAPADLRAAAKARADAISRADADAWSRLVSDSFTVTYANGRVVTKAQRIPQIKALQAGPVAAVPFEHERWVPAGNAYIHQYQNSGLAFTEVWAKEHGSWRMATNQLTVIEPDSATLRHTLDSADVAFAAAMNRGDAKALAALYADNAVIMVQGQGVSAGRAGVDQLFAGFVETYTISNARLTAADVYIAGSIAIERGSYSMTLHPKAGGADVVDTGKYLAVWEEIDAGVWRIVRDCSQSDAAR
jgi:ketosteroid isomerase-like protein